MNYKELFQKVWQLISSPAKAWEEISVEEDSHRVMTTFVYPLIALGGLAVFISTLVNAEWGGEVLQSAMTRACAVFISLFGGYFLVAYLTDAYGQKVLQRPPQPGVCQQFVGYAMVVPFVLKIVAGLFSSFLILYLILQFYVVYVVWEGAQRLMKVDERKLLPYTLCVSALILLAPWLIHYVFMTLITLFH